MTLFLNSFPTRMAQIEAPPSPEVTSEIWPGVLVVICLVATWACWRHYGRRRA